MTLNQVVDRIKKLGKNHAQLHTVRYGQLSEWLDRRSDNIYPLMFIDYPTTSIQGRQEFYNFSIWFVDRVLHEKTNARDVQSDMMEIAKDIFSLFTAPSQPWDKPTQAQFTQLFDDESPDWLGGARMDISLAMPFLFDRCAVPILAGNFLLVDDNNYLIIDNSHHRMMLENTE